MSTPSSDFSSVQSSPTAQGLVIDDERSNRRRGHFSFVDECVRHA
jgi:hypothetical protein